MELLYTENPWYIFHVAGVKACVVENSPTTDI